MKKLNYLLIAMITVFAFSCNNDNDPPPAADAPSITAPTGTSILVGESTNMDFLVNAPGKVAEVTVTASAGTATIVDATTIVGSTSGTITVTYVAPLTEGTQTVTLTVKDAQATAKTTTADASVAVTLAPTSSSELLVAKFDTAPTFDGEIDDMWNTAQKLVSAVEVPNLGARMTYLNSDGAGVEENLGLFEPYSGESYDFTMRSGYAGSDIYFLIEWADDADSRDRQSWYFDGVDKKLKQEHKYANTSDDKYYEDKFAFLFPIGEVAGFSNTGDCYATCHQGLNIVADKDKHSRHYLNGVNEKIDMWHWKRVRGTFADQVDDQMMTYDDPAKESGTNGRHGDSTGDAGYAGNSITLDITGTTTSVNVPKYIIPGQADYYWIDETQINNGTAKLITGVDVDGVLTLEGGATIDPTGDAGFAHATGNKRLPSVTTRVFTEGRAEIDIKYQHTGTGWICEVKRKLNTGDADDVVFAPGTEYPFDFAIFNNAAIAHAIKPGLTLKFEQ